MLKSDVSRCEGEREAGVAVTPRSERSAAGRSMGPPYQRADWFVEGQTEAVTAQRQDQLLTLLQKAHMANGTLFCPPQ